MNTPEKKYQYTVARKYINTQYINVRASMFFYTYARIVVM